MYWGCTECLFLCVAVSSCSKWMLLLLARHRRQWLRLSSVGLLRRPLVAEHRLWYRLQQLWLLGYSERGLCSCGTQASLLWGMWDLPRPGVEPMSLAMILIHCTRKDSPLLLSSRNFFFCWVNSLEFFIHIGWWRKKDSFNFSPFKLDV